MEQPLNKPEPRGMPGIQYFKVGGFRPKPGCHPYFNGVDVYTQICEFDTVGGWAVFVYDRDQDGKLVKLPDKEVRFGNVQLGPDPNYYNDS